MTWSKFSSNSILQGCIDFYCLVCDTVLRGDDEVNVHIEKPIHKKSLDKTAYIESHPDDHVRKLKKGYYCEYCNAYLKTLSKAQAHVESDLHQFHKEDGGAPQGNKQLKWHQNSVIAFDDLLVDGDVWNGILQDTCLLCDCELEQNEIEEHKNEMAHVFKLIQSKLHLGVDNSIARKLEDSSYHCLTCNSIVTANSMLTHFDTPEHMKKYLNCRKAKRALIVNNDKKENIVNETKKKTFIDNSIEKTTEVHKENKSKEDKPDFEETAFIPKVTNKTELMKEAKNENLESTKPVEDNKTPKIAQSDTKIPKTFPNGAEIPKNIVNDDDILINAPNFEEIPNNDLKDGVTPKNKAQIPREYIDDIPRALKLPNYIRVDGFHSKCLLCHQFIDISEINEHLHGFHHATMLKLEQGRAEQMKIKYGVVDKKTEEKPKMKNDKPKEAKLLPEKPKQENPRDEKANQPKTELNKLVEELKSTKENKDSILESVQRFQKNHVLIDLIYEKARCSKCSITIEYNYEKIIEHIDKHNGTVVTGEKYPKDKINDDIHSKEETKDEECPKDQAEDKKYQKDEADDKKCPKDDKNYDKFDKKSNDKTNVEAEPEMSKKDEKPPKTGAVKKIMPKEGDETETDSVFAEKNGLTYNTNFDKAYCRICGIKVPSSRKCLEEHVKGNMHKKKSSQNQPDNIADMTPNSQPYHTTTTDEYIDIFVNVNNDFRMDVIINDEICISARSFLVITGEKRKMHCHLCDVVMNCESVKEHVETKGNKHDALLKAVPVVIDVPGEFIREVHPGVFHCGFCNVIERGWECMTRHINTESHARTKLQCSWRLEESMDDVRAYRMHKKQEEMRMFYFMHMLMRGLF